MTAYLIVDIDDLLERLRSRGVAIDLHELATRLRSGAALAAGLPTPDALKAIAVADWTALRLTPNGPTLERTFEGVGFETFNLPGRQHIADALIIQYFSFDPEPITTGAPLALLAPIISIALGAEVRLAPLIVITALIGGLGFAFCGGIGAALSLGSKRGGVLIAVIVLPLFAPPVIFGAGAIDAFAGGLVWKSGLMLLGAYSLAAVGLGPFAMAAACRNALS